MKNASKYLHLKRGESSLGPTLCGLKDPGIFTYATIDDHDPYPPCPPCWQQRIEDDLWFPIETAPKDGSGFLVGELGGDRIDRAFFMEGALIIIGGNWTPTHWRRLPASPKSVTKPISK